MENRFSDEIMLNEELALLPAAFRDRRAGLLLPPHVHYLLPVNHVEPEVAITA